jgi:flagellar motor component MotA
MNRAEFIEKLSELIKYSLMYSKFAVEAKDFSKSKEMEQNAIDSTDKDFTHGIYFIIDGMPPSAIDEIYTNKIAFEKDPGMRQYKTVLKRALLGIQAREQPNFLYHVLVSYVDLSEDERKKLDQQFIRD